jgi:hypothetical protein
LDIARFGDFELPFTAAITTKRYTFETWIYSQTYVSGQFGTYSFIWNRYLKLKISENANGYYSACYPLWENSYTNKESNVFETPFTSNALPWVYLRCSVNIQAQKYFHFSEKTFTTEKDFTVLTNDITDVLSGTSSLKFVNENKNRGILYFRLLRLFNCYDCQIVDDYRINWINVKIIQEQIEFGNLLYHVDGRIQGNEAIDISSDDAETKQKIKYIMDNSGVKEFSLTPLSKTDFFGYNALDITTAGKYGILNTPKATNYMCPENTYYCLGLIKLNEVTDVKITQVTPSFSGKYTIEFWTYISDITKLIKGFHIIWKGLGSVSLIQDPLNTSVLNMVCWPQDFKFDSTNFIEDKFGGDLQTLYGGNAITNRLIKTRTSNINNKWLYVRCAVNTNYKRYYSVLEDEKTNGTATVSTLTDTTPMKPTFTAGDTTYVLLNGMSLNTECTIYLRNLWLHSNYLPTNNRCKSL